MKLSEAIKKSKRQKITGWLISTTALILLLMGAIKYIHAITYNDTSVFQNITNLINSGTVWVYQETIAAQPMWDFAPSLSYPNIFTDENLKFAAVLCFFIFGIILRDSGLHLARRIFDVKRRAEEKLWEKSLTGESTQHDIMSIDIAMESKDNWYTRPSGMVVLAIVGGYMVNVLTKATGI